MNLNRDSKGNENTVGNDMSGPGIGLERKANLIAELQAYAEVSQTKFRLFNKKITLVLRN
jgi:hypothetical protein